MLFLQVKHYTCNVSKIVCLYLIATLLLLELALPNPLSSTLNLSYYCMSPEPTCWVHVTPVSLLVLSTHTSTHKPSLLFALSGINMWAHTKGNGPILVFAPKTYLFKNVICERKQLIIKFLPSSATVISWKFTNLRYACSFHSEPIFVYMFSTSKNYLFLLTMYVCLWYKVCTRLYFEMAVSIVHNNPTRNIL